MPQLITLWHKLQDLVLSSSTFQEPVFQIDDVALELWKSDQLRNAEALLTSTITSSQNTSHHALASRALVRTRLQEWDTALADAEKVFVAPLPPLFCILTCTKAIEIRPSVIGYIAKSVALVGKGDKDKGYQTCDIAFALFHSSHVCFLLLVKVCILPTCCHSLVYISKAIIVFMAGDCRNAVSRVDDLTATVPFDPVYYIVQACPLPAHTQRRHY